MGFDVYFQCFRRGEAAKTDAQRLAELLEPHLVVTGPGVELRFGDGDAAIYGLDDPTSGFMVNHIAGRQAWDVLVAIARELDLAVVVVGCPVAVAKRELLGDLPDELRTGAAVVDSGNDLLRLLEAGSGGP